jgi:hypothetical protein
MTEQSEMSGEESKGPVADKEIKSDGANVMDVKRVVKGDDIKKIVK